MLEFIRSHKRFMQVVLLLFIVPSFALFGLESYTGFGDASNVVAKVAGDPITSQEWEAAQREQMDRLRETFGEQFDPRLFDTAEAKQAVLDNLISQRVLAAEAARQNLTVPDQALQQAILGMPGLTGPDGKFDTVRYKELLGVQGLTPTIYEARLRQDLAMQQLNAAIQTTAFAPKTVANLLSDLNDQERTVQEMMFSVKDYLPKVNVTDEMLKAYYEKNAAQFQIPERVDIEYVVLSGDTLASQIQVSDADIESYYKQNSKRYTTEEQRQASHILINVKKDASDAERAAAKAKAEALLADVRKNPANFAAIAKASSQDPGSAEAGGDLGFFGKGAMVKQFEDVAFKLKPGEVSDVVESDFGYHIIKVTDVKPGAAKPLAEVREEIAAEIRKQMAGKKYAELAETFNNTVYEQSDSLKPVADQLNLKIQTAQNVGRQPAPALPPTALYNNPKFLQAIFSDDTVKNKNNTEAVEVAPNTLVAGRVTQYKPAAKRPFEEVKATIRERVVLQEAYAMARKAGEEKLAALKTKDDQSGFGDKKIVSRAKAPALPTEAVSAILKGDVSKLPAYRGVELPSEGFAIYRIVDVSQPKTTDVARRQTEQQQIASAIAQQETFAYLKALREKAEVEIIQPVATENMAGEGRAQPVGSQQ